MNASFPVWTVQPWKLRARPMSQRYHFSAHNTKPGKGNCTVCGMIFQETKMRAFNVFWQFHVHCQLSNFRPSIHLSIIIYHDPYHLSLSSHIQPDCSSKSISSIISSQMFISHMFNMFMIFYHISCRVFFVLCPGGRALHRGQRPDDGRHQLRLWHRMHRGMERRTIAWKNSPNLIHGIGWWENLQENPKFWW